MLHSTRKSAWRRSALLVMAAVLVMTMMAACGGSKEHSLTFKGVDKGDVVATYKEGKVTQAELDKFLSITVLLQPAYESLVEVPQYQKMLLEQLVFYKVLNGQASADSIKEADKQVDEQLKQFADLKKTDADFAAQVKEKKISDADIATFLMMNIVPTVHMNSKVTDEDTAKAFETMKADFAVSTVRHVLVATHETNAETQEKKEIRTAEAALARAKEVKAKLDAGESWDTVAKTYSDDPGSKDKGGLYEASAGKSWVAEFKKAAFEQKIGVIGEPVKTEFGYHVMLVEKREEKTFDQLTAEDKEQVKGAAAYTHMEKFMKEEMPKQELKITLPEPKPTEGTPSASPNASESPAPSASPAT
ncbi:peptidylprolyl isomerase [Paenibacillus sp. GCM10027627]|uniref:peptidylprolyl isomerase n=1 Tax=unclassified Paenibacillus TaxID=185978 RepID=UPI00363B763C